MLTGIKRVHGPLLPRCLSIILDHLQAIQQGLDFDRRDHVMLWAACRLGFFGFLQAREITVNFSLVSMTVDDLQTDSLVNPTCFKVHIKSSKTDLFCMGCEAVIYMLGVVCPIHNLGDFLALHGSSAGPLFTLISPLTQQQLSSTVQSILHSAGNTGSYLGHSFCIGAATTDTAREFRIICQDPRPVV